MNRTHLLFSSDPWNIGKWLLIVCGVLLPISGLSQSPDEAWKNEIRQQVEQRCQQTGFNGYILMELEGEVVVSIGVGQLGTGDRREIDAETLFEIGSVSKPVTAMALLRLVEDGKLSLDDPISKYLPNVPENCQAITVRHLVQHTSGMPGTNYGRHTLDVGMAVNDFLRGGPRHDPGTHFEYWNQGYALLSAIISKASGKDYPEAVNELIFEPAEMGRSCFTGDAPPSDLNVALGKSVRGADRSALSHPYGDFYGMQYRGMGGVVSTATDMHRLLVSLRNHRLLNEETVKQMLVPGEGDYGLGWKIESVGDKQRRVFHRGGVRGFLTSVAWYPEDQCSLILLASSDNPSASSAVESLCRNLMERRFIKAPEHMRFEKEMIDSLVGNYELGARTIVVSSDGISLKLVIDWGNSLKTNCTLYRGEDSRIYLNDGSGEKIVIELGDIDDGKVSSLRVLRSEYKRTR